VVSIPGASAITTAIAAAGLPSASFCFHGFLPARKGDREKMLTALRAQRELQVFYEAPHRILESITSIAAIFGGDRRIGIARELTKLFEQVHVCRLDDALVWLGQSENHRRGEFVLLVEGCSEAAAQGESDPQRVLMILLRELPLKQAVELAARITGTKKNALYEKALKLKKEMSEEKK
jgi:16S rRNA (cytidine1402-2'-O)-methyltransferase